MITIEQCRAARGLLGWTQQDLADACGLSKTAINNFEKKHSDIKAESLRAIRMAFESLNIELIGQEGLCRSHDHADILKGPDLYQHLIDDILLTLKSKDDELLIIQVNEHASKYLPDDKFQSCIKQLAANGIKTRIICQENNTKQYGQSRYISVAESKYMATTFIYGSKFSEQRTNNPFLTITSSQEETAAMKQKFEALWDESQEHAPLSITNKKAL